MTAKEFTDERGPTVYLLDKERENNPDGILVYDPDAQFYDIWPRDGRRVLPPMPDDPPFPWCPT